MGIVDTTSIDETKPTTGTATTQSMRDNFSAIKTAFDDVNTRTVANKAAAVLLTPAQDAMLFVGGTDGGWFKGVTGAAASTYSDNGGAYCGTVFIPTGGDGSAAWVRVDYENALPEMFGCVGDAKEISGSDLRQNTSPTDDTASLQLYIDYLLASNNRELILNKWYAVYPATSGNLTTLGVIPDGFVRAGFTYIVEATSGNITYNGTAYTNGQTFTGAFNHEDYLATGDAVVKLRAYIGLDYDRSVNSDGDGAPITVSGSGGLVIYENGVAIAIRGADETNDFIYNAEIDKLRVERDLTAAADSIFTIGAYLDACVFFSDVNYIYSLGNDIGIIASECWNMHYNHLSLEGSGISDVGALIINANSQAYDHVFTHNYRQGCEVEFVSAHSASVGNTLRVAFDSTYYWSGTITEVPDTTTVVCRDITRTTGVTVGVWQGDINSGTDIDIKDARLVGGVGMILSNPDGVNAYLDMQNSGEAGVICLVDGSDGNIGLDLYGHIEGPANGVIIKPTANAVSPSISGVNCEANCYAGRSASGTNFGATRAYDFKNVDDGKIDNVHLQARDNSGKTAWAQSTVYSLGDIKYQPWGFYRCTTAGTSDNTGVGPVGTGTGIADNTVIWEFLRYPSSCLLIDDSCSNVHIGQQITYDHNISGFRSIDLQDSDGRGQDSNFPNTSPVSLISSAGLTAGTSQINLSIDKLGDKRTPKAVLLKVLFTINSFTAATDIVYIWFRAQDGHANSRQFYRITNLQNTSYETQLIVPCSKYGELLYQIGITSAGINFDVNVEQMGAFY